jgi:hypothetical protein
MDTVISELIGESRDTDAREIQAKRRLCDTLGIDSTAVAGEGFVVHSPDRSAMLAGLNLSVAEPEPQARAMDWRFISNQTATVDAMTSLGATIQFAKREDRQPFEYLGFKPATH